MVCCRFRCTVVVTGCAHYLFSYRLVIGIFFSIPTRFTTYLEQVATSHHSDDIHVRRCYHDIVEMCLLSLRTIYICTRYEYIRTYVRTYGTAKYVRYVTFQIDVCGVCQNRPSFSYSFAHYTLSIYVSLTFTMNIYILYMYV